MTEVNVYVAAIDARIAHEHDAHDASKKMLQHAKAFCAIDAHADFMQRSSISAFFNEQENAKDKVCMKMIDRAVQYLRFAVSKSAFIKADRAKCVLQTAVNLHNANASMTLADAQASCTAKADKKFKVTHENAKCIAHCDNIIDAVKRQASMSLLALCNINVLKQVNKNEYVLADTEIAREMIVRLTK